MTLNPVTPNATKKPRAHHTEFADARRACRTPAERERLGRVIEDGWTEGELREFARLYFPHNGKDYPTPASYRSAVADIFGAKFIILYSGNKNETSYEHPYAWLNLYRNGGSKPLPPRRVGLLQRGRGLGQWRVSNEEYAWPGHTEEFRTVIEQRARDYFGIASPLPVHVNAWAASYRAYGRECYSQAEVTRKATEATALVLSPKKSPKGAPRRKLAAQFDEGFCGPTLKPHFRYDFPGHTPAFREEVAARARKDKGLRPNAYVSPRRWKAACHRHYVLIVG